MARALGFGWDQPAAPAEPKARTIDRYKWKPNRAQQPQPGPAWPDSGQEVTVGEVKPNSDDNDEEKSCPELVRDACQSTCKSASRVVSDFFAGWFGAVHLHHFSADDFELDVPKSAAAREVRRKAMTSSTWSSNFHRINPKVSSHPKGWSGALRTQQGWAGDPNPRPESSDYWKHTWGLSEDEPMITRQHYPLFTAFQCIACFLLWLIFRLRDGTELGGLESIWPWQTDLVVQWDCVDLRREAWRWWTYQFTHIGLAHIGGNCIMTLFFGVNLEGVHGWWRMFLMFNIGVFGGSCCYFVSDPFTRVVGMSGGCYALVGMHFGDVLMNFSEQRRAAEHFEGLPPEEKKSIETLWRKMIISPKKKIALLVLFVGADLVQSYASRGGGVSLSAHFGGFIAGFLVCIVVGHNLLEKGYERVFWVAAFVAGAGLVCFCMAWGLRFPPQDIWEQVPWCWGRQIANVTAFGDNTWQCVRCSDNGCIARWVHQRYIQNVTDRVCRANGGWTFTDA